MMTWTPPPPEPVPEPTPEPIPEPIPEPTPEPTVSETVPEPTPEPVEASSPEPAPEPSLKKQRRPLTDTLLVLFLLAAVWTHTPVGQFPMGLYLWLTQPKAPAPWAPQHGNVHPTQLRFDPGTPLFRATRLPISVDRSATRLGINPEFLNAIAQTLGTCTAVDCRIPAPPHLTTILDTLPTTPTVGAYDLATGLSKAREALQGSEELALEALFAGIPNVRRAIHFAQIAGVTTPEAIDHHLSFFPSHVPKASLDKVRAILANHRLRYYTWPVPSSSLVTSSFGQRTHPVTGQRTLHKGIDIDGDVGDAVVSAQHGTVFRTGRDSLNGKYIKINHDFGIQTVYCHLDRVDVKRGQQVERGVIIGALGQTGRVTGSHLHFGLKLNSKPVNPQLYGRVPLSRAPRASASRRRK
jgi:hypothetical protein